MDSTITPPYVSQRTALTSLPALGPPASELDAAPIEERTTRHPGYRIGLSKRWLVEKPLGWLKQIGGPRKVKLRGLAKVDWLFVFECAAYIGVRHTALRRL